MIGVCIPYRRCLATYTGIRIAQLAEDLGYGSTILSTTPIIKGVNYNWDNRTVSRAKVPVRVWARSCSHVVWVGSCHMFDLLDAATAGAVVILVADWTEAADSLRSPATLADLLICPSWQMSKTVRDKWAIKYVQYIPWDPGIPISKHDEFEEDHFCVFMPSDSSPISTKEVLKDTVAVLESAPELHANIIFQKNPSRYVKRLVTKITLKENPERLHVYYGLPPWHRLIELLETSAVSVSCDTNHGAAVGVLPLTSLTVGTPVITYNSPMVREYLSDQHNCIFATPGKLADTIDKVMTNKFILRKLKRNAYFGLIERRKRLINSWREVFKSGGSSK